VIFDRPHLLLSQGRTRGVDLAAERLGGQVARLAVDEPDFPLQRSGRYAVAVSGSAAIRAVLDTVHCFLMIAVRTAMIDCPSRATNSTVPASKSYTAHDHAVTKCVFRRIATNKTVTSGDKLPENTLVILSLGRYLLLHSRRDVNGRVERENKILLLSINWTFAHHARG
jgi:hypothetical protein